jgi:hypothetical protein
MRSIFAAINQGQKDEILDFTRTNYDATWFFLGDVHGDPSCLTWIFQFLRRQSDFRLCFLGDLFDRGPDEIKCLEMFIQFADSHPGKVFWIAGNHDVPYLDKSKQEVPINENTAMKGYEEELSTLPLIAWFPKGIIATHGGWSKNTFPSPPLPGSDLTAKQKMILQTSRLNHSTSDLIECELDNLPSFQTKDLSFSNHEINNSVPIKLLIRGHDHPMEGYHLVSDSDPPSILTLMGSTQLGVQFFPKLHRPWTTLAVITNWNMLQIIRINSSAHANSVRKELDI